MPVSNTLVGVTDAQQRLLVERPPDQLRNHLDAFFASFATGSSKLLQYVGLG